MIRLTRSGARLATTAVVGRSSSGKTTFLTIDAWRVSELALLFSPSWIASHGTHSGEDEDRVVELAALGGGDVRLEDERDEDDVDRDLHERVDHGPVDAGHRADVTELQLLPELDPEQARHAPRRRG